MGRVVTVQLREWSGDRATETLTRHRCAELNEGADYLPSLPLPLFWEMVLQFVSIQLCCLPIGNSRRAGLESPPVPKLTEPCINGRQDYAHRLHISCPFSIPDLFSLRVRCHIFG